MKLLTRSERGHTARLAYSDLAFPLTATMDTSPGSFFSASSSRIRLVVSIPPRIGISRSMRMRSKQRPGGSASASFSSRLRQSWPSHDTAVSQPRLVKSLTRIF